MLTFQIKVIKGQISALSSINDFFYISYLTPCIAYIDTAV